MKISAISSRTLAVSLSLLLAGSLALAQSPDRPEKADKNVDKNVAVKGAWIRSMVKGQQATGAYMLLTAREGTRLVGVSTPVAGVAEVHEMKMENDIMKMRAAPVLDLPAGKTVALKPNGYHVMLMDLNQPLLAGSVVPLTLQFKDAKGLESRLELSVPVSTAAPGVAAGQSDGQTMDSKKHQH